MSTNVIKSPRRHGCITSAVPIFIFFSALAVGARRFVAGRRRIARTGTGRPSLRAQFLECSAASLTYTFFNYTVLFALCWRRAVFLRPVIASRRPSPTPYTKRPQHAQVSQ
jgi:hypothetical protein